MATEDELRQEIEALRDELERLRTTLAVVGPVDIDSGTLNRTGILDALERGRHWLIRRGDVYGLVVVRFPELAEHLRSGTDAVEFRTHVTATLGAAVREVDSVGSVAEDAFAAVLADLNAGALPVVVNRIQGLVARLIRSDTEAGRAAIGAVEVLSPRSSGTVLQTGLDLAQQAGDEPVLEQLE